MNKVTEMPKYALDVREPVQGYQSLGTKLNEITSTIFGLKSHIKSISAPKVR